MVRDGMDLQADQLSERDSDSDSSVFDVLPMFESSVPLTLSLSSHFLLTNGTDPSSLAVWDIFSGELMTFLDETRGQQTISRLSVFRFAEISADRSMIFSVNNDLFLWNFVDLNHSQFQNVHRYFLRKSLLQGEDVWIGYETHSK